MSINDYVVRAFAVLGMLLLVPLPSSAGARVGPRLSTVRIPFSANEGQTDSAVAFFAQTLAGAVFVTRGGQVVYSLPAKVASTPRSNARERFAEAETPGPTAGSSDAMNRWSLTETFAGGNARPAGTTEARTRVSYFLGANRARWRSDVRAYDGVSLGDVWPGISVELAARGESVEKRFTVAPGGDPAAIRMRIAGAQRLHVDATGALVVATGLGDVTFTPPAAFQQREGIEHRVAVAYTVDGLDYGFSLGDYDAALPVSIDPLLQTTYLGGSGLDQALGLVIHPTTGDAYVAGFAASTDFPGVAGGAQATKGASNDAFIARLDATLTTLVHATYLGGSGDDRAYALAIHPGTGDVYVTGSTYSTNFPGTAGGAQPSNNAGLSQAAFVARLDSTLTTLTQATYFAGGVTVGYSIAIHPTTGDVYAAGSTIFAVLPGTTGSAQPDGGGGVDGFVAKFNAALTTLDKATYLGGSGGESAQGVVIHPTSGDVYVTGETDSTNLPGTAGGAQPTHGVDFGNSDAFVAHLNSTLTTLLQATYLGGNNQEVGQAIAIHPTTHDVYVAGWTESSNFPGTAGGAQSQSGAGDNVFVSRLDSTLTTLDQSTYLGANGMNRGYALAIHPASGDVYVAGLTTGSFPGTSGGAQPLFGGFQDGFVARLNAALTTLDRATYLGGTSADLIEAIAIHPTTGDVYVAGYTFSSNMPGTAGGAQPSNNGSYDAFVARLTADLAGAAAAAPVLSGVASRKIHGSAGTFDLPLAATPLNPTTEPRTGPSHTIVFTFDKPVTGGTVAITEGIATAGAPTFNGNEMVVPLTGVSNQQYVTIAVSGIAAADGGSGGSGSVRLGFLLGDVSQNRVVTVSDLALVNAQVAQVVAASNFLKDVNVSGTLSIADKGITNAQLTRALVTP